jgi:predicted ATP-dependent endonuclease of OLD family
VPAKFLLAAGVTLLLGGAVVLRPASAAPVAVEPAAMKAPQPQYAQNRRALGALLQPQYAQNRRALGALLQGQSPQDAFQKEMQDRMFKEANKKRQQDIKNDTDKLFALATELKAAVDKTNENMLSLDVIKKAEQVEKLAKKVKENMKEVVGPPQNVPPPVPLPTPFSH